MARMIASVPTPRSWHSWLWATTLPAPAPAVCVLVDKEEIGTWAPRAWPRCSSRTPSPRSGAGWPTKSPLRLRRGLTRSRDNVLGRVRRCFDPAYASVFEAKNSATSGARLVFSQYTGSRGKSGSNGTPRPRRRAGAPHRGRRGRKFQNRGAGTDGWRRRWNPHIATSPRNTAWTLTTPACRAFDASPKSLKGADIYEAPPRASRCLPARGGLAGKPDPRDNRRAICRAVLAC